MHLFTYVMAITDHKVENKWNIQYAFFRDVKGFQGMHFVDGDYVWHGPQVIDVLWQQAGKQGADDMTENGACNYTTPKVEWISRFFSASLHERNHWVTSGLYQQFSREDNQIFLNYKRRYEIALANSEYHRHNFVSQRPFDKHGYAAWKFADKQPECVAASKRVQGILNGMHRHAFDLAKIFYGRIRRQGKHLYCFEFRQGEPLFDCETVWDHVKHYHLASDP